jgi:hypothetical protein
MKGEGGENLVCVQKNILFICISKKEQHTTNNKRKEGNNKKRNTQQTNLNDFRKKGFKNALFQEQETKLFETWKIVQFFFKFNFFFQIFNFGCNFSVLSHWRKLQFIAQRRFSFDFCGKSSSVFAFDLSLRMISEENWNVIACARLFIWPFRLCIACAFLVTRTIPLHTFEISTHIQQLMPSHLSYCFSQLSLSVTHLQIAALLYAICARYFFI